MGWFSGSRKEIPYLRAISEVKSAGFITRFHLESKSEGKIEDDTEDDTGSLS